MRINEGLSLTNVGGPAGDGCELTEDENDKGWHGGFGVGDRGSGNFSSLRKQCQETGDSRFN